MHDDGLHVAEGYNTVVSCIDSCINAHAIDTV